ncbi:hypothetical protein C8R43DRAFT_405093 [Mycena crocata]|nr:hypothetical protein C8R43DRAFT_405093 [Mycena crocata]
MDVEQQESRGHKAIDSETEAAAAKIWAVYVSEAEKYDKGLVESWKGDMEGMLIFAGLFSASLTAFLIESYKTLNADSSDATVQLLSQISRQLAASANGSILPVPEPSIYTASTSALVCNALWFLSLGLSLTCALVATLLEQWARDFLHRSEIRSALAIRARMFSFLYYGLKHFNMHAVVDIIPLLLHTSLLFFFAGLVAFLIPVNTGMAIIAAMILFFISAVYCILTFLPLRYLDCPYHTPLSSMFWRILQYTRIAWRRRHGATKANGKPMAAALSKHETMVEAISRQAIHHSDERLARDGRALVWTVKSLSDDSELEPFVEAIPDVLWGPTGRRSGYQEHIWALVVHPEVQLYHRIVKLFYSCDGGLLSWEARTRRAISSCQALWVIATLSHSEPASINSGSPFESPGLLNLSSANLNLSSTNPDIDHFRMSARAMMEWTTFREIQGRVGDLQKYLSAYEERDIQSNRKRDLTLITTFIDQLAQSGEFGLATRIRGIIAAENESQVILTAGRLESLMSAHGFVVKLRYLRVVANLSSLPFRWDETINFMRLPSIHFPDIQADLDFFLPHIVGSQLVKLNTTQDVEWMDSVICELFDSWCPRDPSVTIPSIMIRYLNERSSDGKVPRPLYQTRIIEHLWVAVPQTLANSALQQNLGTLGYTTTDDQLWRALWRLAAYSREYRCPDPSIYQSIIDALQRTGSSQETFLPSLIAMIKNAFLKSLLPSPGSARNERDYDPTLYFTHPVLPIETAVVLPSDPDFLGLAMDDRICEGQIQILAEFLESCVQKPLPYKAVETIQAINIAAPCKPIHETHQLRLTNALRLVSRAEDCMALADEVVQSSIFYVYAEHLHLANPYDPYCAWLDNDSAREVITQAFQAFTGLGSPQAREIIVGLNSRHTTELFIVETIHTEPAG